MSKLSIECERISATDKERENPYEVKDKCFCGKETLKGRILCVECSYKSSWGI